MWKFHWRRLTVSWRPVRLTRKGRIAAPALPGFSAEISTAKSWWPAFRCTSRYSKKGALYYTGDCHAAQGDGEITVNAIETANSTTLQFIVHKGMKLAAPRAETPTHYIAFGLDPDLGKAMHMAMTETLDFLKAKQGYDFFHAYTLASIAVDFRVTQVVDATLGIHAMIPKKLFVKDPDLFWYRAR